jgi:hypothetical protein
VKISGVLSAMLHYLSTPTGRYGSGKPGLLLSVAAIFHQRKPHNHSPLLFWYLLQAASPERSLNMTIEIVAPYTEQP